MGTRVVVKVSLYPSTVTGTTCIQGLPLWEFLSAPHPEPLPSLRGRHVVQSLIETL